MLTFQKPAEGEYAPYTIQYISQIAGNTLSLTQLDTNGQTMVALMRSLPAEKLLYRYAEGKWTLKEVLVHIIDSERIFAYRTLRFARNDATELSGFEQDDYVPASAANSRDIAEILDEYTATRQATLALLRGLPEAAATRTGRANGNPMSVRAGAFIIAGHELHHLNLIRERYL